MGVTAKTIKVVVVTGSRSLQDTIRNIPANPLPAPIDRATGQAEYLEQAFRDWDAVLAHSFNTWGRKIEFVLVDVTVPEDEAAQRADAFTVEELKPFAVIAPFSGSVFAAELVAKKIIVIGVGGVTNAEAARQAPYRWAGGSDSNATAVNAAQFAGEATPGRDGEVVRGLHHEEARVRRAAPLDGYRLALLREHREEGGPRGRPDRRLHGGL